MDRRSLFALACAFNHGPAVFLHPSRRAACTGAHDFDSLWDSPGACRHLSRMLLASVHAPRCDDLTHREWMLALLDAQRLDRIALHITAAVASPQVRASLTRNDVIGWREWLGDEAHGFALQQATLLPVGGTGLQVAREGEPAAFGWRCLATASTRWPGSMGTLFRWKLPEASDAGLPMDARTADRIAFSVLHAVEPTWCSSVARTVH